MPTTWAEQGPVSSASRPAASPLSPEELASRQELVHRIVCSTTFMKSQRLGSLLQYICDLTLAGREAELKEQSIGHAVFGRAPGYDSAVDGIVRSQASRLRQRLDVYFAEEGGTEPLRITIPRGRYIPAFVSTLTYAPETTYTVAQTPVKPLLPHMSPESGARPPLFASRSPWLLSAVLVFLLVGLWMYDHKGRLGGRSGGQAPHPLWSHLFIPGKSTMVVAPDSGLVLFHNLSGEDFGLKSYMDGEYRSEVSASSQTGSEASRRHTLIDLANRRYTSIVDVRTILALKDRAELFGSGISMRYARDLRPDDFKIGNAILLGASEADPWIELYERDLNFILQDDYKGVFVIRNRSPRQGEPIEWASRRDDPDRRVFGVVAFLSSLSGDGNVLLLEGTGMSGAEAGMDFVLDDSELLPFLKQVRRSDGTLPHFELLLETHNVGASAVKSKIIAWRTPD